MAGTWVKTVVRAVEGRRAGARLVTDTGEYRLSKFADRGMKHLPIGESIALYVDEGNWAYRWRRVDIEESESEHIREVDPLALEVVKIALSGPRSWESREALERNIVTVLEALEVAETLLRDHWVEAYRHKREAVILRQEVNPDQVYHHELPPMPEEVRGILDRLFGKGGSHEGDA